MSRLKLTLRPLAPEVHPPIGPALAWASKELNPEPRWYIAVKGRSLSDDPGIAPYWFCRSSGARLDVLYLYHLPEILL